jgi:type IX secretion system PorP/SprF family membrane protein
MRKSYALRVSVFLLFVFFNITVVGQQEPQFTQNMFTRLVINPAVAGSSGDIAVTGLLRQQWAGFKDNDGESVAPQTYLLTVDAPVRVLHGGVGAVILNDKLGFEKNIGLKLSYAYRTEYRAGILSIGPVIGFLNKTIDFSKLKPVQSGDPLLASAEEKTMLLDLGLGAMYTVPNKYWFGISTSQLLQSGAKMGLDVTNFNLKRHYYLHGGYTYLLPNYPLIKIEPSLLIKTDAVSLQMDLNALATYNNKFWAGVTYRLQDAIAVIIGVKYKSFNISYAYDLTTSKLGSAGSSGSHEIMLNYNFKLQIDKFPKSYRNTRFL